MNIATALRSREPELSGRKASKEEIAFLRRSLPTIPDWLVESLTCFPIIGLRFEINSDAMQWLSPEEIVAEARDFFPGIVAVKHNLIPVAECLFGSGDPFFVNATLTNPPLIQIFHDAIVDNERFIPDYCRQITLSMYEFFLAARIGA